MSTTIEFDKSELPIGEEISRDDCFASFLTDEDLTDMTLQGNDGVRVRASRLVLAGRSKVFRSMLLGNFSEAKKDTIPLDFKGCVLKAIVEYIVTDSAAVLKEDEIPSTQTLMSLMEAAIYFDLPVLCEKVFHFFAKSLRNQPSLSFAVLEACKHGNPTITKQLKNLAVSHLRANIEAIDTSSVAILSDSTLEEILKDEKIPAGEYLFFELVRMWAESHREQLSAEADAGSGIAVTSGDAMLTAREMVKKHIHLEWIDPEILATSVASSDIVSQELLLEAFKVQAMSAKKDHKVDFKRIRCIPVWNSSGSGTSTSTGIGALHTDVLNYHSISSGVHQWTIEVVKKCGGTWLGVASTSIPLNLSACLAGQKGGWMYAGGGSAWHRETKSVFDCTHPEYKNGSKVTFSLDLTQSQARDGTLSASIDGGNPFILFENMRDYLEEDNESGFVPAVSLCSPGEIRLLSIERLE